MDRERQARLGLPNLLALDPRNPMKRLRPLALALTLGALALTGCSTGSTDDDAAGTSTTQVEADAFPVTIEHAFGTTTIEKEPERVATLGWSDQDHVVA